MRVVLAERAVWESARSVKKNEGLLSPLSTYNWGWAQKAMNHKSNKVCNL